MILTIEEIRSKVAPIAQKYQLKAVYIFGSYAKDTATEDSDIDLLIDRTGSLIKGLFDLCCLNYDLCEATGKDIDLVTTHMLTQKRNMERSPLFIQNVLAERILIYG